MNDKDFAHLENNLAENEVKSPASQSKVGMIVVLSLMFAIVCFAVGFFMGEKYGLESHKGNKHELLLKKLETQRQTLEDYKKESKKWQQQEAPTSQVGELTFYNELPDQSIIPEPLDGQKSVTSKAHAIINEEQEDLELTERRLNEIIEREMNKPVRQYRIQIASFKHPVDASNFVQQLNTIDIIAEVRKVNLVNLGIRYRVITLAFEQREGALRAKEKIKEKFHVTGILITR